MPSLELNAVARVAVTTSRSTSADRRGACRALHPVILRVKAQCVQEGAGEQPCCVRVGDQACHDLCNGKNINKYILRTAVPVTTRGAKNTLYTSTNQAPGYR